MNIKNIVDSTTNRTTVQESTTALLAGLIKHNNDLAVQLQQVAEQNDPASIPVSDAMFVSKSALLGISDGLRESVDKMTAEAPAAIVESERRRLEKADSSQVQNATVALIAGFVEHNTAMAAKLAALVDINDPHYAKPNDAVFASRTSLTRIQRAFAESAAELQAHAPAMIAAVVANTPADPIAMDKINEAAARGADGGQTVLGSGRFGSGPGRRASHVRTYSKPGAPDKTVHSAEEATQAVNEGYTLVEDKETYPARTFVKAGQPDRTVTNANEEHLAYKEGYAPELFGRGTETVDPRTGRARSFDPATGREIKGGREL